MSSHGQDRLETGAPDSLSSVPTQRQGKAQRSGTTPTSQTGRHAAPRGPRVSRATVAKAATAAATGVRAATSATKRSTTVARTAVAGTGPAKAASTKAVTTKAVGTRAVSTKAASTTAAPATNAASAKAAPATKAASAKAATKAESTKTAPATKAASAKAATAVPMAAPDVKSSARASVTASGRTQRPTPYKRVAPEVVAPVALATEMLAAEAATPELEAVEVVATEMLAAEAATPELEAVEVVAAVAAGHRPALLRRRPPSLRRRPALYLAAALVGALSVTTFAAGPSDANAVATAGHSVSIADKLGVKGQSDNVTPADATHLVELAASRNQRGADQAAAARAQATANRKAVAAAKAAARPHAVDPVAGARLTSTFGMRWGVLHAGIDLAAPIGTPEYAAMDGVVLRAGPASGFGLAVYIQHANGDVTVYGHMEKILVQEGQVVRAGDTIALLGAMGQATGPHLHFEVHVGGMMGPKIDPIPWLQARGVSLIPAH